MQRFGKKICSSERYLSLRIVKTWYFLDECVEIRHWLCRHSSPETANRFYFHLNNNLYFDFRKNYKQAANE